MTELGWLSEATTFADAYLARLQDPSIHDPLANLPGTGDAAAQDALYKAFRRVFPALDVGCLDPEDPLGYVCACVSLPCLTLFDLALPNLLALISLAICPPPPPAPTSTASSGRPSSGGTAT